MLPTTTKKTAIQHRSSSRTNERTVCVHTMLWLWHVNAFEQPFCRCICITHNAVITSMAMSVSVGYGVEEKRLFVGVCNSYSVFWCTICCLFFVQKWIKCIEEYTVFILLLVLSITCSEKACCRLFSVAYSLFFFRPLQPQQNSCRNLKLCRDKVYLNQKTNIYSSHIKLNPRATYT